MVNKAHFHKTFHETKVALAVNFALVNLALMGAYFPSDKEEGASGAIDDGYLD